MMRAIAMSGILLLLACTASRRTVEEPQPAALLPTHGELHLHVTRTSAYCGGADPGPEGMPRPEPWEGSMFLRRVHADSGDLAMNELREPVLDTIHTDGMGHGYLTVPAGNYLILDRERVDDERYRQLLKDHAQPALYTEAIDKACLDRWLFGPFGVITVVGGDTAHAELPLFDQCPWYATPCVRYNGPLPP